MDQFIPSGNQPRMTKQQMKRYLREMELKRARALLEIEKMEITGELQAQKKELETLEQKLDELT